MPTMRVEIAYIKPSTAPWDVEFHVSRRYSRQQLHDYVVQLLHRADIAGVQMLELSVFDGEQEIWSGLL